jgi:hypothetical protein
LDAVVCRPGGCGEAVAAIRETELNPYSVTIHAAPQPFKVLFGVRPRAGVWHPFAAGVPNGEKERVEFTFRSGARGFIPAIAGSTFLAGTSSGMMVRGISNWGMRPHRPRRATSSSAKKYHQRWLLVRSIHLAKCISGEAADNVSHAGHRKSPNGIVKVESSLDDANGPAR